MGVAGISITKYIFTQLIKIQTNYILIFGIHITIINNSSTGNLTRKRLQTMSDVNVVFIKRLFKT